MSAQIRDERNAYYDILEKTQKGDLEIARWLDWFLDCLDSAIAGAEDTLSGRAGQGAFLGAHKGRARE